VLKDKQKKIYLIGALANHRIPRIAKEIRNLGFICFDNWWSAGPLADSYLKHYAKLKGLNYKETLQDAASQNTFQFDKSNLDDSDISVLVMPAGKSGHLELGYFIGRGKPGYILFEREPSRVDIMYQFATNIFFSKKELYKELKENCR